MKESKIMRKCGTALAKAALSAGTDSATRSMCSWWFYQPQVPKAMLKSEQVQADKNVDQK